MVYRVRSVSSTVVNYLFITPAPQEGSKSLICPREIDFVENDIEKLLEDLVTSYNQNTPFNFQNISIDNLSKIFQNILKSISNITDKATAQREIVNFAILKDLGKYLADKASDYKGLDYQACLNCGLVFFKTGYLERAENELEEAISLLPSYGIDIKKQIPLDSQFSVPFSILASVDYKLGENAMKINQYDVSLHYFRKSLDLSLQLQANSEKSKSSHNSFLSILFVDIMDTVQEIVSLQGARKYYYDAVYCLTKAKEYYKMEREVYQEYLANYRLASILSIMGNYKDAITVMEEAKKLVAQYLGNERNTDTINCLCTLAMYYQNLNRYEEAINKLNEAYQIASKLSDNYWSSACLVNKGNIYLYNIPSKKDAERYFNQARSITSQEIAKYYNQNFLALEGLAEIYRSRNALEEAKNCLNEIVKIPDINDSTKLRKAGAYRQLGHLYHELGDYSEGKKNYKSAIDIYSKLSPRFEAATYNDLAYTMSMINDFEEAIKNNKIATEKFDLLSDQIGIVDCLINGSQIYLDAGNIDRALDKLEECQRRFEKEIEDHPLKLASLYKGFGVIHNKRGNYLAAISSYCKSLIYLDSARATIKTSDDRIKFQSLQKSVYDEAIRLLVENHYFEEAFQHVEKAKSRVFSEQLRFTTLVRPELLNKNLWDKENSILQALNAILTPKEHIKEERISEQVRKLEKELESLWGIMGNSCSSSLDIDEYLALRRGDIITSSDVMRILDRNK
jgi:tetratricopeptide (TPR) repeat protein